MKAPLRVKCRHRHRGLFVLRCEWETNTYLRALSPCVRLYLTDAMSRYLEKKKPAQQHLFHPSVQLSNTTQTQTHLNLNTNTSTSTNKTPPPDFTMSMSHLKRIAIVGVSPTTHPSSPQPPTNTPQAGGHIGRPIAEELLASGRHTITALTRPGSTTPLPSGITRVEVSYTDTPALIAALKDTQFLIITLSVAAPSETHSTLVAAASAAGVPYIMPNVYGGDIFNPAMRADDLYSAGAYDKCLEIAALPNTSYVAMCCGFWFEWSLAMGENCFGIDIKNRKATLYDDGNTRMTTSTWRQCGRGVAGLLALEEGVIREKFRNGPLYVASFTVTQREMLEAVWRVTGTKEGEWEVKYQGSRERYEQGLEEMKGGSREGFAKALYARGFFPGGGADFERERGLHNGVVGVEKEELDEAVGRAVEMVRRGWTPGGGYESYDVEVVGGAGK